MVRAKKETAAKAEAVVEAPAGETNVEETKKPAGSAGRGKRKGKEASAADGSPPKRTLRSNSKTTLLEAPVVKEKEVTEDKKVRKAPAKAKKAATEDTNGNADTTEVKNGASATNGNDKTDENAEASSTNDDVPVEKTVTEKAGKGRKKLEKTKSKTELAKESEEKKEEVQSNGAADKDSKPVKAANGVSKGKKKAEADVKEPAATAKVEDETKANGNPEVDSNDKEKAATGRSKKKIEKTKDEEVVVKKAKKEPAVKPKAAKNEAEESKEEKEAKPATETKKAASKKGAKTKEVAIEHCPSIVFSFNHEKSPRRGSFEIALINDNDEEQVIWSGLKLGPPRKEKFPSDEQLKKLGEDFLS